jgi:hypothetical protein
LIRLSERRVEIQLSERRVDPVIKRGWLGSSYQRGGLIQLSERRVDPVIREEG